MLPLPDSHYYVQEVHGGGTIRKKKYKAKGKLLRRSSVKKKDIFLGDPIQQSLCLEHRYVSQALKTDFLNMGMSYFLAMS